MRFGAFCPLDWDPADGPVAVRFQQAAEQVDLLERLGFDSCWFAENHFSTENGVCPSPAVLLAHLFARTQRLQMGPAICVLPLHHPLRVAEDYGLLDTLSGGRLLMGVGTGLGEAGFRGFDIPSEDRAIRFEHALTILEQAWAGDRVERQGPYYRISDVRLPVRPVAKRPRFWISTASQARMAICAAGGHGLLLSPFTSALDLPALREALRIIAAERMEAGVDLDATHTAVVVHVHVDRDGPAAIARGVKALERRVAGLPAHADLPPAGRRRLAQLLVARALDAGLLAFGSPAAVVERLRRLQAAGVRNLVAHFDFGAMPHDDVLRSMELMGVEVMPRIRELEHA